MNYVLCVGVLAYAIVSELFSSTSPQAIYDKAAVRVQNHPDVSVS